MKLRLCGIENCQNAHYGRGWCLKHYKRWRRHGDPEGGIAYIGEPLEFLRSVVGGAQSDGCIFWPYARGGHGYGALLYDGKVQLAHRVVCELAHGAAPSQAHEAAHSCGNGHKACIAPAHLRWATSTENSSDKEKHGTLLRGGMVSSAKLSEAAVQEIRSRVQNGERQQTVARDFGVSQMTVSRIWRRTRWAHLA